MNERKARKLILRGAAALLCAAMLTATACTDKGDDTSSSDTVSQDSTPQTDAPIPVNTMMLSETFEIEEVSKIKDLDSITVNMNTLLKTGYGTGSIHAAQFETIKDKVIIFRYGKNINEAYVLGEKVPLDNSVILRKNEYFIAANELAKIIGEEYVITGEKASSLTVNGRVAACENKVGTISIPGAEGESVIDIEVNRVSYSDTFTHYYKVRDAATLLGLNAYETDSGIIIFSYGEAFDPVKGYYIAEEAAKLFMTDAQEIEEFTSNQFVDIPNMFKYSENNVLAMTYPQLDLHAIVSAYGIQGVDAAAELAPAIVAGEGADASNHTIVRIFDRYQTLHTQFCAYPSSVLGGVQVASAAFSDGYNILTAPYSDAGIKELLVYDCNGAFKFAVKPTTQAPYAIAAGCFTGENSDTFAVMSMYGGDGVMEIFSAENGSLIKTVQTGIKTSAQLLLSVNHTTSGAESVIVNCYEADKTTAYEINGDSTEKLSAEAANSNGIYSSAFGGYLSADDEESADDAFSTITVYKDGTAEKFTVSDKENKFYSNWAEQRDDTYVTYAQFWHLRADLSNSAMSKVNQQSINAVRSNVYGNYTYSMGDDQKRAALTQYNMWEPCFTHRWNVMGSTLGLSEYADPATGDYRYVMLNNDGERTNYLELGSSFLTGSYAPYIPEMARVRSWSMRSYMNELMGYYRQNPELTVAISPVHEQEIDTGSGSIGDYNTMMIEGFKNYLLGIYGSLESINRVYGTEFATLEDFDPPRNKNRGAWDRYNSGRRVNPYFNAWVMYNRTIVSQRILESYSEVILAGFPVELIKAHQIPEGDAVPGFLGNADGRITPVDVVLNCGTGYGGTRYGVIYSDNNSFFMLAHRSGHNNITLGEYASMSTNGQTAYNQLKALIKNGLLMTHTMGWAGNVDNGDLMDEAERYAIQQVQADNEPRSASSGGTGAVHEYQSGDVSYNILQLGAKDDSCGLLKSVNEDGSFEGTVYNQPFHSKVMPVDIVRDHKGAYTAASELAYDIAGKVNARGVAVEGVNYNDTVDLRITAKSAGGNGRITIKVYQNNYEIPSLAASFNVTDAQASEYRYSFKNQTYFENCRVVVTIENAEVEDMDMVLIYEQSALKYYGQTAPVAHKGGVSFDVID